MRPGAETDSVEFINDTYEEPEDDDKDRYYDTFEHFTEGYVQILPTLVCDSCGARKFEEHTPKSGYCYLELPENTRKALDVLAHRLESMRNFESALRVEARQSFDIYFGCSLVAGPDGREQRLDHAEFGDYGVASLYKSVKMVWTLDGKFLKFDYVEFGESNPEFGPPHPVESPQSIGPNSTDAPNLIDLPVSDLLWANTVQKWFVSEAAPAAMLQDRYFDSSGSGDWYDAYCLLDSEIENPRELYRRN